MLANERLAKASQSFENCVLVNKNLCGKLVSSLESPTIFDETFKVFPVPFRQFYVLSVVLSHFTLILY